MDISLAVSFNNLAGMSSGPDALFDFMASSCFYYAIYSDVKC